MKFYYYVLFFLTFAGPADSSFASISLPAIFSDHMVLQQNKEVAIWGWGKPLEEVTVSASWDSQSAKTLVTNKARWQVKLKTPKAGGPYTITIKGHNTVVIRDVLIGEVWLCAGQSNMEWTPANGIDNAAEEIRRAHHPQIRFFNVSHRAAPHPQTDLDGEWVVCTPETMKNFSAIGYFFGKELQSKINVPVGLINSSWGGTPAEIWMSAEVVEKDPVLQSEHEKLQEMQWAPKQPGYAFNAMIAPLIPYKIAGALWYQGETNTYSPDTYAALLPRLVYNWRNKWGDEFPFYYVQIAPYDYTRPYEGVLLRDAQRKCLTEISNAGMAVISDIGDIKDIHPRNKKDVGIRLANMALHKTYGHKDLPYSGPLYREIKPEKRSLRIYFDHAENGLVFTGKSHGHFLIAGEDQNFVYADAKIEGNTIVVSSSAVKKPVAVRFAWSNTAEPDLFNAEGLPASCFRSDDWEINLDNQFVQH